MTEHANQLHPFPCAEVCSAAGDTSLIYKRPAISVMAIIRRSKDVKYLFFSGKGGVGKTSVSAATALSLSRKNRVLIISTDPAHSLSDSFGKQIGAEIKEIGKNLFAVEIDPSKALSEYKDMLSPHMEKMDFLKGLGMEDVFDVAGMTPGVDEVAAFDKFMRYMNEKDYDYIVFDTAPTGHTLRFLSLPDILDSWLGKAIRIRMKFSGMIGTFKKLLPFGEEDGQGMGTEVLDKMKERIVVAKQILSDPKRTSYNIVMIPEEMSILESERSLDVLKEYGIPVKNIIVNQLIPENPGCSFCTEKRKTQQKRLDSIRSRFSAFKIMEIPMFKEEVRGEAMLHKLGERLSQ